MIVSGVIAFEITFDIAVHGYAVEARQFWGLVRDLIRQRANVTNIETSSEDLIGRQASLKSNGQQRRAIARAEWTSRKNVIWPLEKIDVRQQRELPHEKDSSYDSNSICRIGNDGRDYGPTGCVARDPTTT